MKIELKVVIREIKSKRYKNREYYRYYIPLPTKIVELTELKRLVGKPITIIIKNEENGD